jgi:hypothetical protein
VPPERFVAELPDVLSFTETDKCKCRAVERLEEAKASSKRLIK